MISCEFCEISKNTFSWEHIQTIASGFFRFIKDIDQPRLRLQLSSDAYSKHIRTSRMVIFWEIVNVFQSLTIVCRSSRQEVFLKKDVLRNFAKFTGKHLCQSLRPANLLKKRLAQVFSCEFYEISKNTVLYRTPPAAASVDAWLGSGIHLWNSLFHIAY